MRPVLAAALLALLAPLHAAPVDYRYRLSADAQVLSGRVCLAAAAAQVRFRAGDDALASLSNARRSSGAALAREASALSAREWRAGECLELSVDVARAAAPARRELGGDLLLSPARWLWRPEAHARAAGAELTLELPVGWSVSAPWPRLSAPDGAARFELGSTSPQWPSLVALGRFREQDLAVGRGTLRVAAVGALAETQRATLERYARDTAHDVAHVFPHAFALAPQLLLIPVGVQRDAVPFGQSYRGGGVAVLLYVDPARPLADYHDHWTLAHELVHPLHPSLGEAGRWLAEGIATYYQNVIRARAGRIGAREAWQNLEHGFRRGRAQRSALTLDETSRQMGAQGLYMRGYWSGTALALRADVAWRAQSGGAMSLEQALDRYAACCLRGTPRRRVLDYAAELDRLAGTAQLAPLLRTHAGQSAFPEVEAAYAALGLRVVDDGVAFDDAAPFKALRAAIMGSD
jgi:hypothetical protein